MIDPSTTKYLIKTKITADGVVEKPDVIGAIFGQTEGLLGEELDLRDLQKGARIGRIEVEVKSEGGKSVGEVLIPSSLDQVDTAILAAALETIDRIGPCKATVHVESIADVRAEKRQKILERAKELLTEMLQESKQLGTSLADSIRDSVHLEEITTYGADKCPAGPLIEVSDEIIIVEGRSDVLNLLKNGIKNTIAVEGTNVPKTIQELSKQKTATAFVDGDRGGTLILKELLQVAEVDFIARAPPHNEVEELSKKQIMKALKNKMPVAQYMEMYGIDNGGSNGKESNSQQKSQNNQNNQNNGKNRNEDRKDSKKGQKNQKDQKEKNGSEESGKKGEEKRKKLSPQQEKFYEMLRDMAGKKKARLLNSKGGIVTEVQTNKLIDVLGKEKKSVNAIVFDGVITQRLVDMAHKKGVKMIVGTKMGNVAKLPSSIQIWTKKDFE